MTVQAKTETVAEPKEIMANPLVASVVANCLMAAPASAGGALFDFNLTLPIMVGQFVLLVFFLDNVYFKRVAKILAERDELIRNKLASAGDDNSELLRIEEEIESGLAGARSKGKDSTSDATVFAIARSRMAAGVRETHAELRDSCCSFRTHR